MSKNSHRRLPIVQGAHGQGAHVAERRAVLVLAVAAVALYAFAYTQPWWHLWLFAPQYPQGLQLTIHLNKLGADVREIDMLNHYIGMESLTHAAALERRFAVWGVGLVGALALLAAIVPGRRLSWAVVIPGILFPVGFLADSLFWLQRFGHHLDRHAPLHIPVFTPEMFGWGHIGQFSTYARPDTGFMAAVGGLVLLAIAAVLRRRVCESCTHSATCGNVCPTGFIVPPNPENDQEKPPSIA